MNGCNKNSVKTKFGGEIINLGITLHCVIF